MPQSPSRILIRATGAAVVAAAVALTSTSVRSQGVGAPMLNLEYDSFTLDNGLRVIVHEDRKAPVVAVSIWYHVGSKNEPQGQTGFAHLFEHLMFNGSEHYDGEWFEPLQRVGGTSLNGSTWLDRTNYFQTVPTPALDLVLWMESDRMGHLLGAVTQEKLDNQRGVVQNEKRQGDNRPYGRVNYNLYEGLFPVGHPYHHSTIGSMADLDAASLADVHQWFRDYYGPNNAVLSLAGDIDLATAREKVQRYFGDIPAGPEVDAVKAWIPVREHDTHEIQHDQVPAVLANRAWVAPGLNDRDRALLDLAAAALGQGRNSRLYVDLIHDRSLATQVNVSVTPFELASVVDLSVILNPGQPAEVASEAIDRVIARFLETGPTAGELARAVAGINARTVRGLEEVGGFSGKAVVLAEGELYAGDPLFIERYLDWINAATPTDVRDAARRWLSRGWHQVDVVPAGRYAAEPQGVDRSAGLPPVPDNLPKLTFPTVQTGTLSNGVRVVLAERRELPLVQVSMQFDAGYAADAGGTLGVASFAMAMLDRGTTTRDSLAISAEAERLGAQIAAGSVLDTSSVTLSALAGQLEPSLALWVDLIRNPTFADAEIERLRGQWLAVIAQEKAQPESLALRLLPLALYGRDHAYGVPFTGSGTVESISSITRDDLVAFRDAWLRPDNATIFIVGDTTLAAITPLLESAFRGWTAPAAPRPTKNVADVQRPSSPRVILIDKPGSPQSLILAAHVIPGLGTDRDVAYDAMNGVLGGSFTARINMNLREDKGWSYGVRTTLQGARGPRPFLLQAPVQTDRTGESLTELIREFEAIRTSKPIEQAEMDRVIAGLTRGLPGSFETTMAVLNSLMSSARYGRPLDYAATLTDRYEALRLADLQSAATDIVHPESLVWVIVGDLGTIRDQVEKANIGPIEIWNDDGQPVR
ncbi:MAG: peptidase M16 [Acidobacteria bacterium SCN 69-37]|nr:MAG: peptidase M16 [Acidobacteria bacterium SCN 69-37]